MRLGQTGMISLGLGKLKMTRRKSRKGRVVMALKNRKDMDPRFQWKLSDIFETPEAWEAAYAKAKKAV